MKDLNERRLYKKSEQYYNEMVQQYEGVFFGFIENQAVISVLLIESAKRAKKEGIDFRCRVPHSLEIKMKENEVNVLISNLIENAFEATYRLVQDRWIELMIGKKYKNLYIRIKNPIEKQVENNEGFIRTTKVNKEKHGHGLKSVQKVVNGNRGMMELKVDDNVFSVSILIPNQ